ncbi:STAS/SEC14 domain-containing protein [Solirhodobacter olei]|uniref:STAS/SEC14 domain-containing protein n=1 Tax=Solirhodobacter olei TaxID=2493082 RepID=UPI000FD9DE64|nr:STAS/SEC14 domain-containing protein [Solirhodobacter olei]
MTETVERSLTILTGFPADVLAVEARGHVGRSDYEEVLIPAVRDRVKAEGRLKMLYKIGPGFEGFSAGAAWDDAKLGFLHMGDFARIAVVADIDWIRMGVKLMAPLMACPVHVFHLAEIEAAKDWISSNEGPGHGGPEVDVQRKLPLGEDMMPPQP